MPDTAHGLVSDRYDLSIGRTDAGEAVLSNCVSTDSDITICVPCYRDNVAPLMSSLKRQTGAQDVSLILFDDGSDDEAMTRRLARHVSAWPGPAKLVTAARNGGRAHARNRLCALAETDWILFLDADMRPDNETFLARYVDWIKRLDGPALIAGGFTLWQVKRTEDTALHAAQAAASECMEASAREKAPGQYVFTSNILVHRTVLESIDFDGGFEGWGWEDVDWGLRVAEHFPVHHIDNTATHLGLDVTDDLLEKYGTSGANFARLVERNPEAVKAMPLYRMARRMQRLPARNMWAGLAKGMARQKHMPMTLRLNALKTYRALCYAEHLK